MGEQHERVQLLWSGVARGPILPKLCEMQALCTGSTEAEGGVPEHDCLQSAGFLASSYN